VPRTHTPASPIRCDSFGHLTDDQSATAVANQDDRISGILHQACDLISPPLERDFVRGRSVLTEPQQVRRQNAVAGLLEPGYQTFPTPAGMP
jgi:hypothetical protein